MDPAALGVSAVALLVPFLSKVGDRLADRAGVNLEQAIAVRLERLYRRVKSRLQGDRFGEVTLERLEQQPDNRARQVSLAEVIDDLVAKDPEFATSLRELVEDARRAGGAALARIVDAGAVALHGDISLQGTNVAGRDLTIGNQYIAERDNGG